MKKARTILKTMRTRHEENSHGRGVPSDAPVKERERFAPGSPEHKSERVEIRCSPKVRALAERKAARRGISMSELFRELVEGA